MTSVRIRFARVIAGIAALSLLIVPVAAKPAAATAAHADGPPQPNEIKTFGDWTVRCYPVQSPSPCEMVEILVNKQSGRRILEVLMAYIPSRNQHVVQVAVPLGVMLQSGAVMDTDAFKSPTMRFNRCDMQGCYAIMGLDDQSIDALGKATKASLNVMSVEGKKFDLKFSLNGFTAAHSALVELEKQKATNAPPAQASGAAQ